MSFRILTNLTVVLFVALVTYDVEAQTDSVKSQIQALKESATTDPVAARKLGLIYLSGKQVPQDVTRGIGYLEQAVKLGDVDSARFLLKSYQDPKSKYYSPVKAAEMRKVLGSHPDSALGPDTKTAEPTIPKYSRLERWQPESLPTGRPRSGGSGFAVNANGVFITNFHVIAGCNRIVVIYNGMRANARLIGASETDDLAALQVSGKTSIYLPLRKTPVSLGESVTVAGYPIGITDEDSMAMKLSEGIVARLVDKSVLQMSASVSSGNSGGPVVDKSGSVVGVSVIKIAAGAREKGPAIGDDYNFAVRAERVHDLLKDMREDHQLSSKTKSAIDTEVMAKVLQQATAQIFCYR